MRVAYSIVEFVEGTGQTTMLLQLADWGSGKWTSGFLFRNETSSARKLLAGRYAFRSPYARAFFGGQAQRLFAEADVIHIKSGYPFFLSALRASRPVIYTLHGPDPWWLFKGRQRLNRALASMVERRPSLRHADVVVSVSEWVADWSRQNLNVESTVIEDAIDLAKFRPPANDTRPRQSAFRLLSVGDWDGVAGRKQTHRLFPLFRRFLLNHPGSTLTLVGLSPASLVPLRKAAAASDVSQSVHLVGKVRIPELIQFYQTADILVTATMVEGFYRPVVEGFACGLPAVVLDPRTAVESVNASPLHHVNGSRAGVSYTGSAESFCEATERVLEDWSDCSTRAVSYATKFGQDVVFPKFETLYRELAPHAEIS